MSALEQQIDTLYTLPAGEFTSARNALAKTLKGDDAVRVKRLQKPTAVPWAVNQLFWHERPLFEQVMAAGRALRAAQVAALQGHATDLRSATAAHRTALSAAVAAAATRLRDAGSAPATDALTRMLEAISLSTHEPDTAGRFTEVVAPAGFEALAGITPGPVPPPTAGPHTSAVPRKDSAAERARRETEAAEARLAAERAVAEARLKVEAAKEREARAQAQVDLARQQLQRTESALREAHALVEETAAALERAESNRTRL